MNNLGATLQDLMTKKRTTKAPTVKVLRLENLALIKTIDRLVKQKNLTKETLLKELIDIRVKTDYHLDHVEETCGEVLDTDRSYCQELGLRILAYKIKNL